MLGIGQKFPAVRADRRRFERPGPAPSSRSRTTASPASGRWCSSGRRTSPSCARPRSPAFGKLDKEFKARDAQVLGVSTDSEFVHLAWRRDKEELRNLPFPMLSDIKRELSTALGILDPEAGVAQRATYIVDPQGVIRFVYVTDLNVGRSPEEVLRVLDALADGRAVPLQLEEGRGHAEGGLSLGCARPSSNPGGAICERSFMEHPMTLDTLKDSMPDYARDLKLNLGSVLTPQGAPGLTEKQIWAVALASAIASRNVDVRARHRSAGARAARRAPISTARARGRGDHGHEQRLLPLPAPGGGRASTRRCPRACA